MEKELISIKLPISSIDELKHLLDRENNIENIIEKPKKSSMKYFLDDEESERIQKFYRDESAMIINNAKNNQQ